MKKNWLKRIVCLMLLSIVPFCLLACDTGNNKKGDGNSDGTAVVGTYDDYKTAATNIINGQKGLVSSEPQAQSLHFGPQAITASVTDTLQGYFNAAVADTNVQKKELPVEVPGNPQDWSIKFLTQGQVLWYLQAPIYLGYANANKDATVPFLNTVFYDENCLQCYVQVLSTSKQDFTINAYSPLTNTTPEVYRQIDIHYVSATEYKVQIIGKQKINGEIVPDWYVYFDSTGVTMQFGAMFGGNNLWYCCRGANNTLVGYEFNVDANDTNSLYAKCNQTLAGSYDAMDDAMLENFRGFVTAPVAFTLEEATVAVNAVAPDLAIFLK